MVTLALATATWVVVPYMQLSDVQPSEGLKPYTSAQLRGRQQYIENGCVYCHTQQPRAQSQAPDFKRGWGRAPVAGDYYYDNPHLLGDRKSVVEGKRVSVRVDLGGGRSLKKKNRKKKKTN